MRKKQIKTMGSLEKGLEILCLFHKEKTTISAQEICEKLRMPLSTTYKYLEALIKKGFLEKDYGSIKFRLGLIIYQLGGLIPARSRLLQYTVETMHQLCESSRETVLLTVINGWRAVCIERIETNRLVRLTLEPGTSLPLHAGASSKVLLAHQNEDFFEALLKEVPLQKMTHTTITDPKVLREECGRIRSEGFAYSDSEADVGARAVAAPIFDHKKSCVASLSIAGPADRMPDEEIPRLINMVTDSTMKISRDLGYFTKADENKQKVNPKGR